MVWAAQTQGAIAVIDYGCHIRAMLQQLYGYPVGPVFVELGCERIDPPWVIDQVAWTDHKGVLEHTLKDGPGIPQEARLVGYTELLKQMCRSGVVKLFLHMNGLKNPSDVLTKRRGYTGWLVHYLAGWLRLEPGEHAAKSERRRAAKAARKEFDEDAAGHRSA